MKIIIAGSGFVGNAFRTRINHSQPKHDVVMIDPKYWTTTIDEHLNADCCIIAVNTPTIDNRCDDKNVRDVILQLPLEMPILLKSTVLPTLIETYPVNVSYSPEFLEERHATDDMLKADWAVIGSVDLDLDPFCNFWGDFYETIGIYDYEYMDRATAALFKYVHNSWLAIKVVFFNEIKRSGIGDYKELVAMIEKFLPEKMGNTHMTVPGWGGKYGFGGSCFPKDTEALLTIMQSSVLTAAVRKNRALRGEEK